MAVLTGSWLIDLLLLLSSVLGLLYWYFTKTAGYFEDRGIPFLKQIPFLGYKGIYTLTQVEMAKDLYNSLPGERFFGYFQTRTPTLLVKDPDLIQRIMVKDFTHFQDHGFKFLEGDIFFKNLFNIKGQSWRLLRHKMLPAFTSGKLKLMFDQLDKSGEHLLKEIEENVVTTVDAKNLSMTYSTEVVASTAFGLDFSKEKPQTKEFLSRINCLFETGFKGFIIFFVGMCTPKLIEFFRMSFYTSETKNYFVNLVKANKEYRKKNNIERNDFFQLLLTLQNEQKTGNSVVAEVHYNEEDDVINQLKNVSQSSHDPVDFNLKTDEGVTAHAIGLLMGGSETISGTLSFTLYHIAKDPDIQKKVVEELRSVLAKHGWSYQAVREMPYLDQVLQETLRLYPILPLTNRECTTPYVIPDSGVLVEKGTVITIPVAGLHYDPNFYPDPLVFKPDRFKGNNFKPSPSYLPFGDGPRICIGLRFAVLEMKLCLAKILSHYSLEVDSKTEEPFTYDRRSFSPKPIGGIWINFKKLD